MSKRRLVDTNLIIRHVIQDQPQHAKKAAQIIHACDRGEVVLVILPTVLAECVFVLESFYEIPRPEIAKVMAARVSSPGIELADFTVHLDALNRYSQTEVHFVDCTIAATAVSLSMPVASFDSDDRKFPDVTVDVG